MLVCAPIVVGLAAVIAVVDVSTGRGWALALFSAALLAITIIVVGTITIADQVTHQPASTNKNSISVLLIFYFVPALFAMLGTLLGAVIVAGLARHWFWLVAVIVAAAVPGVLLRDLNTENIVRQVGYLAILVVPEATILAYGITRLFHPATPLRAGQPVPVE